MINYYSSLNIGNGESQPSVIPTELKRFRYGADYAISSATDTYTEKYDIEFLHYKYDVFGTVNETNEVSAVSRPVYVQGVYEESIYWYVERYYDNGIKSIPDYYSTTWTSAGVSAFSNVTLGATKPTRYPNLGTQMMYVSNGRLGVRLDVPYTDWDKGLVYDVEKNVRIDPEQSATAKIIEIGTDGDGLGGVFNSYKNTSIQGFLGYSYRNGQVGTWQLFAKYLLGGRCSDPSIESKDEWFDYWDISGMDNIIIRPTMRVMDTWYDTGITIPSNISRAENMLKQRTIPNGGWAHNFTHWHTASYSNMESFYAAVKRARDSYPDRICWNAGMSEATEYRWFRSIITNINSYIENSNIIIRLDISNIYNIKLELINTPISVEIDLSNTFLSGKNITSNVGKIRSLGNNKYIIEVYVDSLETIITENITQDYINLNKPTIINQTLSNGTLTIDTDMPTIATLFNSVGNSIVSRKLNTSNQHIFTGLSTGLTYNLGVMSEQHKSILEVINT